MDAYRTEEEQVEALKRWWDENGKSTIAAIIIAVSGSVIWQTWQGQQESGNQAASDAYQALMGSLSAAQQSGNNTQAMSLAREIKAAFDSSTYAQFAALHLARMQVEAGDLDAAEQELRWVLAEAPKGSDIAQVTELRLARVVAANGDADQALNILSAAEQGSYAASAATARGDILLAAGRDSEARAAYTQARVLSAQDGQVAPSSSLDAKLASLTPVPARELASPAAAESEAEPAPVPETAEAEPELSEE